MADLARILRLGCFVVGCLAWFNPQRAVAGIVVVGDPVLEVQEKPSLTSEESAVLETLFAVTRQRLARATGVGEMSRRRVQPSDLSPENRTKLAIELSKQGHTRVFVIWPRQTDRGLLVKILEVDLNNASLPNWRWIGPFETVPIGTKYDFGEILPRVSEAVARLVTRGEARRSPEGVRVFVGCFNAALSKDEKMTAVARRLTLELPYELFETGRAGLISSVRGISPLGFQSSCYSSSHAAGAEQIDPADFDVVVTGEVGSAADSVEKYDVTMLVQSQASTFAAPVRVHGLTFPGSARSLIESLLSKIREIPRGLARAKPPEQPALQCRIDKPAVDQASKNYGDQCFFVSGDKVKMLAGGCVQTGGAGKTWKRYVDPQGPGSERLYHGNVLIPGEASPRKLDSIMGQELRISQPGPLILGYEDDGYQDNGYDERDPGVDDQCLGQPDAWVEVSIVRSTAEPR